ncbi:MAG TPA: hypothetical protein VFA11_02845 [Acidimicrobiales bacterium]|nr:hypothetical protein [Acidimicrobiales bacterium]
MQHRNAAAGGASRQSDLATALLERMQVLSSMAAQLGDAWGHDEARRALLGDIVACSRMLSEALGELARGLPPVALEFLDELLAQAVVRHSELLELDAAVA